MYIRLNFLMTDILYLYGDQINELHMIVVTLDAFFFKETQMDLLFNLTNAFTNCLFLNTFI